MSACQQPPLALLKALIRPYGARLFKKPRRLNRWVGIHYEAASGKWVKNVSVLDYTYSSVSSASGGLVDADYFYWWGSPRPQSNYSMCRVCRAVCFGVREREMHLNAAIHECRRYIYNAFEVLRRDKRCAVCDGVTDRIRLGVYLCNLACEDLWKTEPSRSDKALREALRIVGYKVLDY